MDSSISACKISVVVVPGADVDVDVDDGTGAIDGEARCQSMSKSLRFDPSGRDR